MSFCMTDIGNDPLDLIDRKPELIDFLVERLRGSLPEVFTFQQTLDDVNAMVRSLQSEDQYKPRYDTNFALFDPMCAGEPELVRSWKGLLELYHLIHVVADHHGRALTAAEIIQVALAALGAEKTVCFDAIVDEVGAPTGVILIASEAPFEKKYGVRVRVITKDNPSNRRPKKGKRGLRGSRK